MHLALDPDAHSSSSPVRILVAGHSRPSGSCPLQLTQCVQETMGQDGKASAFRCLLSAEKPGVQAAKRNHSRVQGPWHRDCSKGTHPTRCCSLLHAESWQASVDLGALSSQGRRCTADQVNDSCRVLLPWPQIPGSRA